MRIGSITQYHGFPINNITCIKNLFNYEGEPNKDIIQYLFDGDAPYIGGNNDWPVDNERLFISLSDSNYSFYNFNNSSGSNYIHHMYLEDDSDWWPGETGLNPGYNPNHGDYLHPCLYQDNIQVENNYYSIGFIISNSSKLHQERENEAHAIFIPSQNCPIVNGNVSSEDFTFLDDNLNRNSSESIKELRNKNSYCDLYDIVDKWSIDTGDLIYIYPIYSNWDSRIYIDDQEIFEIEDSTNPVIDRNQTLKDVGYVLNLSISDEKNCEFINQGGCDPGEWKYPDNIMPDGKTPYGLCIARNNLEEFGFNITYNGISSVDSQYVDNIIGIVLFTENNISKIYSKNETIAIDNNTIGDYGYSIESQIWFNIAPVYAKNTTTGPDKTYITLRIINPTNHEMSLDMQVESSESYIIDGYMYDKSEISISDDSTLTFGDIKIENLKIAGVGVEEFTCAFYAYDDDSLRGIDAENSIIKYDNICIIITPKYIESRNNFIEIDSNNVNNYNNISAIIGATTNPDILRTINIENDEIEFKNTENISITSKSSIEGEDTLPYMINITLNNFASSDVTLENILIKGEWTGWAETVNDYLNIIKGSINFKKTQQVNINVSDSVTFSNVPYNMADDTKTGYALKITTLDATYEVIFDYNTYMCGPLLGYVREKDLSNTNTILLQKSDGNEAHPEITTEEDEDIYGADTIVTEDDMLVSISAEGKSSITTINPDITMTVINNLKQSIEKSGNMSDSCTFQTANQFIYFRLRNPYDGSVLNYDEEAAYGVDKTEATQHEQINFLTLWEQRSLFDALNGKPTYVNEVNYYVSESTSKEDDAEYIGYLKRKTRKSGRALVDNIDDWFQWYKREETANEVANGNIKSPGGSPLLFVGPYLSNDYDCCINSDAVRSSMTIGPGESITVPIIVLYKTYEEDGRNEAAYSVGFDIRNSLYSDPLFYQFTINAKYSSSVADITSSQKANISSSNKYNSTVR